MKTKLLLKSWIALLILFSFVRCGQKEEGGILPVVSSGQSTSSSVMPVVDTIDNLSVVNDSVTSGRSQVWACKSPGAKRYHFNKDCGGLKRCSHEIEKLSVADAEAVGLTVCGYKTCR